MKIEASTPKAYIEQLPAERKKVVSRLRTVIRKNLPQGFREEMNYNMIGYVVPHKLYPAGYHCNTALPLPFMNLASQKGYIAIYHMGIYANKKLYDWFVNEYKCTVDSKPDMGKSCIRFKKTDNLPYGLIGQLAEKMTPQEWIELYEKSIAKKVG